MLPSLPHQSGLCFHSPSKTQKTAEGTGEMAQKLGVFTVLVEDPSSVASCQEACVLAPTPGDPISENIYMYMYMTTQGTHTYM